MKGYERRTGQRLVALGLLGALAFNYPILGLFNRAVAVLGIPLLYAYIFAAWALLIAAMALVVERGRGKVSAVGIGPARA